MKTLDDRLNRFVEKWEPSLAQEFWRYDRLLRAKSRRPPSVWGQTPSGPYWKELPRWLAGERGNGLRMVAPEFLDAVLWGQTALFYTFRLQDDLLDRELPRSPLSLAPLLFLTEADCAYSSLIERNAAFWKHYRQALETTVSGIVRVAEMQRDYSVPADELLQVYGSVDAVFSVGSLAICQYMGTPDWIPPISEFVRELGKVLLTLDDMEDIDEDLTDGRLNYPARMLLDRKIVGETELPLLGRSLHGRARAEGFDEIKTALLRCLSRAARAIGPLRLQPAMDLIEKTRAAVQNLAADLRLTLSLL